MEWASLPVPNIGAGKNAHPTRANLKYFVSEILIQTEHYHKYQLEQFQNL